MSESFAVSCLSLFELSAPFAPLKLLENTQTHTDDDSDTHYKDKNALARRRLCGCCTDSFIDAEASAQRGGRNVSSALYSSRVRQHNTSTQFAYLGRALPTAITQ